MSDQTISDKGLFRDRTPASAAWQLALVLAEATEEHIALLDSLPAKTPKARREWHEQIVKSLVYHCHDLNIECRGFGGRPCPRLAARISQLKPHSSEGDV